MLRSRYLLRLLASSTIVLGCATSKPCDRTTEPGGRPLSQTTAGSVILTGEDLSANPGWTVLDAIRRAMPQVKISTGRGLNPCPLIELRGRDSVTGSSDPDVYVDGTRTVDTCPLVTLQAIEASRIEIYPVGVTGEPLRRHGRVQVRLVQHRLVIRVRQAFRDLGEFRVRTRDQRRHAGAAHLGPPLHALHEQRHPLLVRDLCQARRPGLEEEHLGVRQQGKGRGGCLAPEGAEPRNVLEFRAGAVVQSVR